MKESTVKDFVKAIKSEKASPIPYDTTATVVRVDGDTVWVHIAGGVDETPVRKTVNAKVGDSVQVRISGGKAWITGNATAPPTDDEKANIADGKATKAKAEATAAKAEAIEAKETANAAQGIAVQASEDAIEAKSIADNTNQYFWNEETGTDTGAHITEVPQDEWNDSTSPNYHSGGNLLARSNGIAIRDGMQELAVLEQAGLMVKTNDSNDNEVVIANLGFGDGNVGASSGLEQSPYYTFGTRKTSTTEYSNSRTYDVGDVVLYDGLLYVCTQAITSAESWTESHWKRIIGSFSHVTGVMNTANGYCSHAEGFYTMAGSTYAHSEGGHTIASGTSSHAEGNGTTASGPYAHSEGMNTVASRNATHAEGYETTASGLYSHAQGYYATASGENSHAEGRETTASGSNSHSSGYGTVAQRRSQTVVGEYNQLDTQGSGSTRGEYAFIVGKGSADNNRSNALTVDWNGNVDISGKYKIDGAQIGSVMLLKGSSYSSPLSTSYKTLNLSTTAEINTGNAFTADSNGIKCAYAGTVHLIGKVRFNDSFTANDYMMAQIYNTTQSTAIQTGRMRTPTQVFNGDVWVNAYARVNANDVLLLRAENATGGRGTVTIGECSLTACYISA